ncbi:MAG: DUF899 domain-containing protein [Deltaproteobacteria bacterium]|jgi:predicted dithiol-disulfide oxidoreductase (DUF899 family)|nr:DUF899 domain-containing protein [Deltaproteobacteria bacterium]MBT4265822.1 DUF899 domain-containing protein [Deltaproteobacteria bacterium]MBT4638728.1 DUF899 domain-containing protein [Deltaproteobacteria bacterium]MBT6503058.1 DUF899 domain-containing protein [Deltaproteobacteria bacterium]MBT7151090.1 DUF899 domain-containing protein [Deltaproteobacteria bacterium]
MKTNTVVTPEEWLEARKNLLVKEKEFVRLRDELSQQRRSLPWVRVEKEYEFKVGNGQQSLSDLFADKSQLMIYHFMFGADWEEGCPSCSFWADNFEGIDIHLAHRDITFMAISNTEYGKLEAYKKRMEWTFKWVSSLNSDFNYDFGVSFTAEEKEKNETFYNFRTQPYFIDELPGVSVFYKDEQGNIFHTYSTYSRGLDMLNGTYNYIDLSPKGRDEKSGLSWVRRHDQYE